MKKFKSYRPAPRRDRRIIDDDKYLVCSDLFRKSTPDENEQSGILYCVQAAWHLKRQGYRKGVWLVPLSVNGFESNIVQLEEGDYLFGRFEKRVDIEQPRKKIATLTNKKRLLPLKSVDVVVYDKATLAEGGENSDPNADYEILIVLKKVIKGDQPMPPETMMYNYFKANGGTDMRCSDKKFVAQLKESFLFWKDKAVIN